MSQQLYANNAMKRGWLATQNRVAEQASINGSFTLLDCIQEQSQAQMDYGDRCFAVEYNEIFNIILGHERAFFRGPVFKPRKAVEESSDLPALVSESEISKAAEGLANGKSPGPNGRSCAQYFKSDCARHALKSMANYMLCNPARISPEFARGYIKLVYNTGDSSLLSSYKRIFVPNAEFRIVARVFAERLRTFLGSRLSPEVLTLDERLSASDAIYTLQVAAKALENQNKPGAFVKIDFTSISDTISRAAVFAHLAELGVAQPLVNFVGALVGATSAAVEVNGGLTEFFPIQRGFLTGDPLSRVMLAVAFDIFCRELKGNLSKNSGATIGDVTLSHVIYGTTCVVVVNSLAEAVGLQQPISAFCDAVGIADASTNLSVCLNMEGNSGYDSFPENFHVENRGGVMECFGHAFCISGEKKPARDYWKKVSTEIVGDAISQTLAVESPFDRATLLREVIAPRISMALNVVPGKVLKIGVTNQTLLRIFQGSCEIDLGSNLIALPVENGGYGFPSLLTYETAIRVHMAHTITQYGRQLAGLARQNTRVPEWAKGLFELWHVQWRAKLDAAGRVPPNLTVRSKAVPEMGSDERQDISIIQMLYDPMVQTASHAEIKLTAWPPVWSDVIRFATHREGKDHSWVNFKMSRNSLRNHPLLYCGIINVTDELWKHILYARRVERAELGSNNSAITVGFLLLFGAEDKQNLISARFFPKWGEHLRCCEDFINNGGDIAISTRQKRG